MQLWDEILYPPFTATIRGAYYGHITQDFLDAECYDLARRAIVAFKFPNITTEYQTFYAIRNEDGSLTETSKDDERAIPHGRFINELSYNEIEVLIAWMKVYWAEHLISNSDNFDEMYTDVNVKAYSRANALDKNLKLLQTYRTYAREVETSYYRVRNYDSTLGEINDNE